MGEVLVPLSQDKYIIKIFAIKNVDAVCTKNMNRDFLVELELLLLLTLF